jgi:hypothetical protein
VGLRTGLDVVEKRKFLTLPELELRPLGRPDRSQSLYRLRYPGSCAYPKVPNENQENKMYRAGLHSGTALEFYSGGTRIETWPGYQLF